MNSIIFNNYLLFLSISFITYLILNNPRMKTYLVTFLFSSFITLTSFSQESKINEIIKNTIEKGKTTNTISAGGKILFSQVVLLEFYEQTEYQQAWSDAKNVQELLFNLVDSYNEGLIPNDYHLLLINKLIAETKTDKDPQKLAHLDLLMTDAALLYASDLILGKVDQSKIRVGWNMAPNDLPKNSESIIKNAIIDNTVTETISSLKPDHFMYTHLRNGLSMYREIEKKGGWPSIPDGQVLKLGVTDARVKILRSYLEITGYLPGDLISESDSLFDDNVEKAVKKFQYRHNLNQDGIIGKVTLAVINVTIEQRINDIRVNMERARWIIHHLPDDFLVVNIAGFNVRRIINDSTVFYSRVIVGKHYHESPIFDGRITYIELNPTWTLPYSIATKETLPKIKKNPNYLSEKYMIVLDRSGNELDPSSIDFKSLSGKNFPYTFRQKAGPHNALGQVKFMFPNKYAVYLHDTPSRSLFSREKRAFSHGCIRLDKKWELFLNLMGGDWNKERIEEIVKSEKTTIVKLKKPIEILLLYWTAGADKQDNLYFNEDVYDRDHAVLEQLNKPHSFKKVL